MSAGHYGAKKKHRRARRNPEQRRVGLARVGGRDGRTRGWDRGTERDTEGKTGRRDGRTVEGIYM